MVYCLENYILEELSHFEENSVLCLLHILKYVISMKPV